MYSREFDGQVLEFGVSGKLIRNVLVMYDRQTGSLWSQILGRAIEGPFEGAELTYVPSRLTTWEEWKRAHPDTLALVKGYRGSGDPYFSYYLSSQPGMIGETFRDNRLPTKQFVIGVAIGGESVAYPFSALNELPVVNDELGGVPLLVVFDSAGASGVVFDRRVDGQTLSFRSSNGLQLMDDQTSTVWEGLSGKGVSGPLVGARLTQLPSTSAFWFGWKDFYPETRVFSVDG